MTRNFSRKGTKVQTKLTKKPITSFFAPSWTALRLCVKPFVASLVLLTTIPALAQTKSTRFDPDGSFWILDETPNEFSEFGAINLNAKRSRHLPVQGFELKTGKRFPFKTLIVKRDNFSFTTATIGGISYAFSGKFLKGGVYAAGDLDDTIPVLEGTLTKLRGGQKVAEKKLKFSYFGGT